MNRALKASRRPEPSSGPGQGEPGPEADVGHLPLAVPRRWALTPGSCAHCPAPAPPSAPSITFLVLCVPVCGTSSDTLYMATMGLPGLAILEHLQ